MRGDTLAERVEGTDGDWSVEVVDLDGRRASRLRVVPPEPVPPAPRPAGPPPAAPPPAAPSAAPAATATASAAPAGEGKSVYDTTCHVCHGTGLAGSPKFGDKAAWAPRIATGMPALYNAALHGLNAMPPKGGNTALTDAQVKAAVDYMVAAAK